MAPSIGANIRVTGHCNQGRRKYMEDAFSIAYHQTDDERDLEYAFFGIFDGHGGREAALFAKEHLMNAIVGQKGFWSDDDQAVLKAVRDGFLATHRAMWKQVGTWPQTVSGLPSTSGTTASVAFIRKGKVYIGHVGDSAIVLGYKEPDAKHYSARQLTRDHKPESPAERKRIEDVGGSVINKCGVQRVVWNRPRIGHKGPVRRSTHIDQIPFLAVARSLGDLWSYDYFHEQFAVSPDPDVSVVTIDPKRDRCIILATDGVWNMLTPEEAVRVVEVAEHENERRFMKDETRQIGCKPFYNPSQLLVDRALNLWMTRQKRADNSSVVTVMLDPPGPPRSEVLLRKRMLQKLRPRDESEAGPSMGSEWREARSRTMVTHAPMTPLLPHFSPHAGCLGMLAPPRTDHYQRSGSFIATPPPLLPPKLKLLSTLKSAEPMGAGGTVPLYRHHAPYYYEPPAETSAAPSSNPPRLQRPADISDPCGDLIRNAPTPPPPLTEDDDTHLPRDHKPVPLLRWREIRYDAEHALPPSPPPPIKGILRWPNPSPILQKSFSNCAAEAAPQHKLMDPDSLTPAPTTVNKREDSSYDMDKFGNEGTLTTAMKRKLPQPILKKPMPFSFVEAAPQQKLRDQSLLPATIKAVVKREDSDGVGYAARVIPAKDKFGCEGTPPVAMKRKLPPGSRELFTLVAKHTRFTPTRKGGATLWGLCRISGRTHITRSRSRLGKAHA